MTTAPEFSIRLFQDDFAAILPLVNLLNPGAPATLEQLRDVHTSYPPVGLRNRLVALVGDEVAGYAGASWRPEWTAGQFYLALVVDPAARGRGIGTALLEESARWAKAEGATRLVSSLPDDDEPSLAWAQRRGFAISRHPQEWVLDLAEFDESRFGPVVEQAQAGGIRFLSYAGRQGEEMLRRLYEIYKVTDLDSPGYLGTDPDLYPPFEQWQAEMFGDGRTLPDGVIVAADGERFVGLTILQHEHEGPGLYTEYTGVLREYRGRKIALALKLLSIRVALEHGAPHMSTRNDAGNAPMLAVNRALGYVKKSGTYWLTR